MAKLKFLLLPILAPVCAMATDIDIGIPLIKRNFNSYVITTDQIPLSAISKNASDISTDKRRRFSNDNVVALTPTYEKDVIKISEKESDQLIPLTASCVKTASDFYGIHQDILYALLLVEGGSVGEESKQNRNGTRDINLFQMNESNLAELAREFGITKEQFINDGCLSVAVAARHLLRSIDGKPIPTDSHSYLKYLALYHNANEPWNEIYANKLKAAFEYLANVDATSQRHDLGTNAAIATTEQNTEGSLQ